MIDGPVLTFEQRLKVGITGESVIAKYLTIKHGMSIMPVYEALENGFKGPQVYGVDGELIAPDILAFTAKGARWIEAKHKSAFTHYRRSGTWQTGIDLKYFHDYRALQEMSPFPLLLFFLHTDFRQAKDTPDDMTSPTGLYFGDMATMKHDYDHTSEAHGMIYWREDQLRKLAEIDEVREIVQRTKKAGSEHDFRTGPTTPTTRSNSTYAQERRYET